MACDLLASDGLNLFDCHIIVTFGIFDEYLVFLMSIAEYRILNTMSNVHEINIVILYPRFIGI